MGRRSEKQASPKVDWKALEVVHSDAAGIDVGGQEHWVAVSPERDAQSVRCFECFTADLERMADWLTSRGVRSVAMQSTGLYWMPVFEVLQQRGMEVYLVNARHTKNLPGRKSDIAECQWLLKLHTFGLLNNSFQPSDAVRGMRTLWRHRGGLVAQASSAIQRMQKALIEMNIQLSNVLSDLSGVSGIAILQAILAGERTPRKLAALADPQVKASKAVIAKSLQGNWRPELLFVLRQEMEIYQGCQDRIAACDQQLQQHLREMESKVDPKAPPLGPRPKGKRARGNAPKFDLRAELYRLTGVDWSQVDGIDVQVAQTVIAEVLAWMLSPVRSTLPTGWACARPTRPAAARC
jgi:transposase